MWKRGKKNCSCRCMVAAFVKRSTSCHRLGEWSGPWPDMDLLDLVLAWSLQSWAAGDPLFSTEQFSREAPYQWIMTTFHSLQLPWNQRRDSDAHTGGWQSQIAGLGAMQMLARIGDYTGILFPQTLWDCPDIWPPSGKKRYCKVCLGNITVRRERFLSMRGNAFTVFFRLQYFFAKSKKKWTHQKLDPFHT